MGVAANVPILTANDQRNLTVGFESGKTIHHVTACLFQLMPPMDIVFFIKTRFHFQQHRYLLATFCGFRQGSHNRRMTGHPVQRLLDGHDLIISGCISYKADNRFKGIIGMIEETILLPNSCKDVAALHCRINGCGV